MRFLGRKRYQSGLLTGVISAAGDGWDVSWVGGDGTPEPQPFTAATLTDAASQATSAALTAYAEGRRMPGAVLQFAIYPWDYGADAPIYDITGAPGQFRARDMRGPGSREIAAESLEGLVAALRAEASADAAMLRWGRPFAELAPERADQ